MLHCFSIPVMYKGLKIKNISKLGYFINPLLFFFLFLTVCFQWYLNMRVQ